MFLLMDLILIEYILKIVVVENGVLISRLYDVVVEFGICILSRSVMVFLIVIVCLLGGLNFKRGVDCFKI